MNPIVHGRRARLKTRRSGQATVELALIAPILLLLILGLVDFARAWSAHHVIADAAREGARMLVVHDDGVGATEVRTAIKNRLATGRLNPNEPITVIDFNPANGVADRGEPVSVTITHQYNFWIVGIFLNWAMGDQRANLVSTITMRSE
jgi:Flp pilus assembly protein TadG